MAKFSNSGEPEHYFFAKKTTNLIKKISREIVGKIAELLHEPMLKSLDKAVQNKDDLDSDDKGLDEESKFFKEQTPFPDDVYEKKLDLFTFSYLLSEKVEFLQLLVQSLYQNLD